MGGRKKQDRDGTGLIQKKFDYFVCVAFDENHNNIRYFIFQKRMLKSSQMLFGRMRQN